MSLRPRSVGRCSDADGIEEGLILPTHVDELDRLVREHRARLVVVDPLTAHLAEMVNSWRDQSIRIALAPLHHLAQRHGCAVIAVLHLNKMRSGSALHRIGGSIGIPAAARSALLLARDPDDGEGEQGRRRVLAHFKCNVGPEQPSLLYELEPILLPASDGEPETTTARMRLLGECDHSSADLLNALTNDEERSGRDEAKTFLLEELGNGPVPASEIVRAAKSAGIAQRTLERAKSDLGVKSQKSGFGRGWEWRLPASPEDRQGGWQPSEPDLGGGLHENLHEVELSARLNGPISPEERQSELLADFDAGTPS